MIIQTLYYDIEYVHISQIAPTLRFLGVVYADQGQPQKSAELLQRALEFTKKVHGPDHIYTIFTLSYLSLVHCRLGEVYKSEQLAKEAEEALRMIEAVHGPAYLGMSSILDHTMPLE